MSWVFTLREHNKHSKNKNKTTMCLECDFCGIGFKKRYVPRDAIKPTQFCSLSCASSFNLKKTWSNPEYKANMIEIFNSPDVKEKYRAGTLRNIDKIISKRTITQSDPNSYFNSEQAALNRSNAALKLHQNPIFHQNYLNAMQSEEVKEKRKLTIEDSNSYFNSQEATLNRSNSAIKKWENPEYRESQIKAVNSMRQTPESRAKFKAIANDPEVKRKKREGLKRNNSFKKSKPEDKIYKLLIDNEYQVERQIHIDRKIIDFLLTDLNVFIEVDGIYWHGIGKNEEELAAKDNPQAKAIYKKYKQDQVLNKYCLDNKIYLLRITDIIAKKIINNNNIDLIKQLIARTQNEYVVCYYNET